MVVELHILIGRIISFIPDYNTSTGEFKAVGSSFRSNHTLTGKIKATTYLFIILLQVSSEQYALAFARIIL